MRHNPARDQWGWRFHWTWNGRPMADEVCLKCCPDPASDADYRESPREALPESVSAECTVCGDITLARDGYWGD